MPKRALICTIGFYPDHIMQGLAKGTDICYIVTEAGVDRCADQVEQARQMLGKAGVKVEIVKCDIFDPDDSFRKLDELFTLVGTTHAIDVNIGLGSPVLCVMGYTVAALHGQRAYCVKWPLDEDPARRAPIEFAPPPALPSEGPDDVIAALNFIAAESQKHPAGVQRRHLAGYLKRNCRPRIDGEDDKGSDHQKAALTRRLIDRMEAMRLISISPSPRGVEHGRVHLDPMGERAQKLFGHRVPATQVNLCGQAKRKGNRS